MSAIVVRVVGSGPVTGLRRSGDGDGLGHRGLGPQESVDQLIPPGAELEVHLAAAALQREARTLQCLLFRHVLGVGDGLQSVGRGEPEQVADQRVVGGRAEAAPTVLGRLSATPIS